MKKTLMIDLDGVLNTYSGNYKENEISPIRDGAKEFLEELSKDYIIEIFTVRDKTLTIKWLKENDLINYVKEVTNIKNPFAFAFIDDRAINFDGEFENMLSKIKNFKPHWKF